MRIRLIVLSLLIASCVVGFSQQQAPTSDSAATVTIPRLIRFSGQLKDASGTLGITFTLHTSQQGEAALWTETQNVKLDDSGRYTVLLGATKPDGLPTDLFTSGEAQWLGIHIQGQPDQRVLLVSVPYAMKAAEAETLAGHAITDFVTSDKLSSAVQQQLQQQSVSSSEKKTTSNPMTNAAASSGATNFTGTTTDQVVGITQSGTGAALKASATNTALIATSTVTSGTASGVQGHTYSSTGVGVYGFAHASTGTTYGVEGNAASPSGIGVYGYNASPTGFSIGVVGQTQSIDGTGIEGYATSSTGTTKGIFAAVSSPSGTAAILQNNGAGKLISGQSGTGHTEVFSVDGKGDTTGRRFVSTIATGTAPFSVTSKTLVANLNASMLAGHPITDFPLILAGGVSLESSIFAGNATYLYGVRGVGVNSFSSASSGDGGDFDGGNATGSAGGIHAGSGINANGGSATNGNYAGAGLFASGGDASNGTEQAGSGIITYGGNNNTTGDTFAGGGHGIYAVGGSAAATGAQGGNGLHVQGGGSTSAQGGAGIYAIGGNGTPQGWAAVFEQGGITIAEGTISTEIGVSGCGTGYAGIMFTNTSASDCKHYSMLGDASNTYFNRPEGGFMSFRENNTEQMSIATGGNVTINGNLTVGGAISAGTKDFVIDHPLDPQNKLLYHTSIESPDMKTLYDGVVKLDANGEAWVVLPDYFEALNGDFRYMLTSIGSAQPRLHVAREVKGNRFKISGGHPNGKVSWQITGIRHDAYANANRGSVEVEKTVAEKGKYLHPEAFGVSAEQAMNRGAASAGAAGKR